MLTGTFVIESIFNIKLLPGGKFQRGAEIENRSGRLRAACEALAARGINIHTLCLADSRDFGILRLIVADPPAGKAALENAGIPVDRLDAVIVATSTPDLTFPSVATMVQAGLGMQRGFAYDIQAVCAGFVYALANADAMIRAGLADRVLVIGAETFSRIMDWTDRSTCVLFGDGAGAVVLEAAEGAGTAADQGILATDLNSDGRYRDLLYVDGGVASTGTSGHLRMQGNLVFRHAVEKLAQTAHHALEKAGLSYKDITPVYLPPADARAAFQRGAIDAWVIWDPFLAEVETNAKARQIRNAEGLVPHYTFYLASRKFADTYPDTAKQVVDELGKLSEWANGHQDDAAGILSTSTGLDKAIWLKTLARLPYGAERMTPAVYNEQQALADTFTRIGLLPVKVDVRSATWSLDKP